MPENSRAQAELAGGEMSSKDSGSPPSFAADSSQDFTEIARKLAAHGGGAVSLELAFDLFLHGIVQQARAASGAMGAAIALNRDGKLVCRATTGENAPDLGVSVGVASGLTRDCLKTGAIQHCQDTESDSRVDPETCRRLGVRSMLLIPLMDAGGTFGVMQLFCSLPNAFAGREMPILSRLALRVAENRSTMLLKATIAVKPDPLGGPVPDQTKPKNCDRAPATEDSVFRTGSSTAKINDLWTSVLFLLVIVAAISLGIVVGWSNGRKTTTTRTPAQSNIAVPETTPPPTQLSGQDAAIDSTANVDPSSRVHKDGKSAAVPAGGLVVTENGKIIYRSTEGTNKESSNQSPSGREREPIHRVEPDYPPMARAQHIEGTVILDVEIAEDGNVANIEVVSGNPLLAQSAVRAVRQWRYQVDPGGAPRTRVALRFNLPGD